MGTKVKTFSILRAKMIRGEVFDQVYTKYSGKQYEYKCTYVKGYFINTY